MWQFYLKILFINMNVCCQLLNLAKKEGEKKAFAYFWLKVRKKEKNYILTLDKQYIPIKVHCARINLGFLFAFKLL